MCYMTLHRQTIKLEPIHHLQGSFQDGKEDFYSMNAKSSLKINTQCEYNIMKMNLKRFSEVLD